MKNEMLSFWMIGVATVALIVLMFLVLFLFYRFRQTVYISNEHRVSLDHSRRVLEREIDRLHEQMYRDNGRWADLNHLLVDAVRLKEGQGDELGIGFLGSSFVRSMGVDPADIKIDEKLVFVLTPFNSNQMAVFNIIKEQCDVIGMVARRGDEDQISGPILPYIIKEILRARLVVANINGRNANVFYELGIAQALGKPVILVAKAFEDVPFDLRQQQVVLYENTRELPQKIGRALARLAYAKHGSVG